MKLWIRIDIPALDRYVEYLRESHGGTAQAEVDRLAQTVAASNVPLAEALNKKANKE